MSADEHDRLLAYLSHLPQLTASALMHAVGERGVGARLALAGRGLVDTTRLASSPADIWRDICRHQRRRDRRRARLLDRRVLTQLRGDLRRRRRRSRRVFAAAAKWRAELIDTTL